jgi:hypothetical protein
VKPTVNSSIYVYQEFKKYGKLESLLVFNELNQGPWKWWRFGAGVLMLGFVNLLAFSPLSQFLGEAAGGMRADLILALSVLCYILLIEGWIWFKRIRARNCYRLIQNLSEKYDLSPKTALTLAPPTAEPLAAKTTSVPG